MSYIYVYINNTYVSEINAKYAIYDCINIKIML